MQIKQWEDKNLAQYSYGVLSDCEKKIVLIDPSRDPQPYLDWAEENEAVISGIIETHPHADFVSSHLELHQKTGAVIYTHSLVGAMYPHQAFDHGETIEIGKIKLISLHTPGHSPDSISILLEHNGKQHAVFTGDTLFIGDCGRPDLREGAGNIHSQRAELARQMYYSLRNVLMPLNDDVIIYPAHGAGTLCGKNLGTESSSTMKQQKETNWCLQPATEGVFVKELLSDQPFIPMYFPFDVEVNRKGAAPFQESTNAVKIVDEDKFDSDSGQTVCIDIRNERLFKQGHRPGAINIMEDGKFETWLGTIVDPSVPFCIAAENIEQLQRAVKRAAAIGYESNIRAAVIINSGPRKSDLLNNSEFMKYPGRFTIVDVRNESEVKQEKIFDNSLSIPLPQLLKRVHEIPADKPVIVHCAGGYRSAAATSIIESYVGNKTKVYDLGSAVNQFREEKTFA